MDKRLKYEKINNADNVISIDIHNGYSIIAVTGYDYNNNLFITTLFLKENHINKWDLIEAAENLKFNATNSTINSAILKQVSTFLEEGFFEYYINRYEYELKCFDLGNELMEEERLGNTNAS